MPQEDHSAWAGRLKSLGLGWHVRYQRTGAEIDLGLAIEHFEEAVRATLEDHPMRAGRLESLGLGYRDRYQRTGAETDLSLAIKHFEEAIKTTPGDHPERADRLQSLGLGYHDRYQRTGVEKDLGLAIKYFEEASAATPEGHPERSRRLEFLGLGYRDRYQRTGAEKDLERAIKHFEEAIRATPEGHPKQARRLESLGVGYRDRYLRTGAEKDLERAIKHFEEAVKATPENHPERARRLQSLGVGYRNRYLRIGAEKDLELAIKHFEEAVKATPENHPERAGRLQSLGLGYHDRYQRLGAETDLSLAVKLYKKAIAATPQDHPERARRCESLGVGYRDRYLRIGTEKDLELAIKHFKKAIAATPEEHPVRVHRLESLGVGYRDRYQRTGVEKDLELAIKHFEEAIKATPDNHPMRAGRLQSLGLGYRNRYIRTGVEIDLDLAIKHFEEAIKATPEDHPERAGQLESLGLGYHDRYQRLRVEIDLGLAIKHYEEAVEATPEDHPIRVHRLQSLGVAYRDRYQRTGVETDLDLAVKHCEEAVAATPEDHPERAGQLESLGLGYHDRYLRIGVETDLDLAIKHFEEAVRATPDDHPERARGLQSLGIGYQDKYRRSGTGTDLSLALQHFEEALRHIPSPVLRRLDSGIRSLSLCLEAGYSPSAYETASTAVSLIPLVAPRSLRNSDKQYLLPKVRGLAPDAAATALMAGKPPYEALRLLELGRGVIISSLNDLRADFSDLVDQHPQLAAEYRELREQVNAPIRQDGQLGLPIAKAPQTNQRYYVSQKLERMIQNIRGLPGFGRFLLAPSEDEFKAASASGPIVVINVSDHRCDALIIQEHEIRSIPLHRLTSNGIEARAAAMVEPGSLDTHLLEWLWDTIAKPIFDAIGYTQTPKGCLPRLWWIPTGRLSQFPIHAAGYHCGGSDTVLDRVISSYSSSATALVRALEQSGHNRATLSMDQQTRKAVLVGMGKTPGLKDLQFVSQELDKLERRCSSLQLQVCKPQPCREDVIAALHDCNIFHFAGHGETDPIDPSKSSLILRDKPLAVADLFETNLYTRKPYLAYLSACGTGQVKNGELVDESLHLIAAYQTAGFRHVIGTLWEVNDKSCVEAAAITYEWLQKRNMTDDSVSEGLHRASLKLRESWISDETARAASRIAIQQDKDTKGEGRTPSSQDTVRDPRTAELYEEVPLYWVPYVHFGI